MPRGDYIAENERAVRRARLVDVAQFLRFTGTSHDAKCPTDPYIYYEREEYRNRIQGKNALGTFVTRLRVVRGIWVGGRYVSKGHSFLDPPLGLETTHPDQLYPPMFTPLNGEKTDLPLEGEFMSLHFEGCRKEDFMRLPTLLENTARWIENNPETTQTTIVGISNHDMIYALQYYVPDLLNGVDLYNVKGYARAKEANYRANIARKMRAMRELPDNSPMIAFKMTTDEFLERFSRRRKYMREVAEPAWVE